MQTIPNSTLYLCKNVDLDPSYNYTIDFDNITAQTNYFDSKIASEFEINESYSYIRDSQALKVQANIDDLLGINYLFYNNGSKRYYAFITKKEYINPTCTSLTFKLDVLQSFMFNYEIDESFIEREHQDRYIIDDTLIKPIFNTQNEDIETGEYVFDKKYEAYDNTLPVNIKYVMWAVAIAKSKLNDSDIHTTVDTVSTGTYVYLYPSLIVLEDDTIINSADIRLNGERVPVGLISSAIEQNTNVISIEYTPYIPFSYNVTADGSLYNITLNSDSRYSFHYRVYTTINTINMYVAHISIRDHSILTKKYFFNSGNLVEQYGYYLKTSINKDNLANIRYEPKLLLYPFTKARLCCYDSERIANILDYKMGGIKYTSLFDLNYSGIVNDIDEDNFSEYKTMIISKSNEINLGTDRWLEYQLNNKASLKSGLLTNVGTTVGLTALGIATGGVGFAVAGATAISTLGSIANEMIKREDIKQAPDEIRKSNGNFIVNKLKYNNLITMEIYKSKFINNIYKYLQRYGYKSREIKKPNIRSRYYYNYIKTIGSNIKTNIDAEFKNEIANIYDNGITIWHYRNTQTFKGVNNYDYENVEINLMEV